MSEEDDYVKLCLKAFAIMFLNMFQQAYQIEITKLTNSEHAVKTGILAVYKLPLYKVSIKP